MPWSSCAGTRSPPGSSRRPGRRSPPGRPWDQSRPGRGPAAAAGGRRDAYGRLDTVINAVQVGVRVADLPAVAAVGGSSGCRWRGRCTWTTPRPRGSPGSAHLAGSRTERPRTADRDHRQRYRLHPRRLRRPGDRRGVRGQRRHGDRAGHLSDGQGDGRIRLRRRRLRPRLDGAGQHDGPTGPRSAGLLRPRVARRRDRRR